MSANPIAAILAQYPVMILDGALATELEARGCNLNDSLWSAKVLMEQPELIKAVHYDYFAAGADVATTASYQATFEGFAKRGLNAEQASELMAKAIALAAKARDEFWNSLSAVQQASRPRPLVAASVGPYGAMLADGSEYRGHYGKSEEELMAFHRPRMQVLVDAGADLLACETIPCLTEAQAIARLMPEFPGIAAWISFSCKDEAHNSEGELLSDCVAALESAEQIAAVGINCTAPQFIPALVKAARAATSKPVMVYPNSGESYDPENKCWHGPANSEQFAEQAQQWHQCGASLIGGCCRTSPADIRAVAHWARRP
ncbi:homocysteine methyltransferase [Pokkaliibacter plantistimulans]|uniref:Homocysteine methyltransferase n=1 Tax=Pokkaliibacter plantistimulans TaxID=1635171 RepID=A0ABX5M050_9GAMM|nr:homocysteine S-methyltransferase [Pokkaliibacter plantistimulans]PXF32305.1 homocysteine methyltransferase [Pokkaliibacter plantistimulans]